MGWKNSLVSYINSAAAGFVHRGAEEGCGEGNMEDGWSPEVSATRNPAERDLGGMDFLLGFWW